MREEFSAIISGWTLVHGCIGEKLEEIEKLAPFEPDEQKTIEYMTKCQIAQEEGEGDYYEREEE